MRSRPTSRVLAAATGALVLALTLVTSAQATSGPGNELNRAPLGMRTRQAARPGTASANVAKEQMPYQGGHVATDPRVYVVFWGSQWGSADAAGLPTNDPSGVAPLYTSFISSLYGSGDTWSTSTTQYCEGVAVGTINCGTAGTHVGHPSSSPLAGIWLDNTAKAPKRPSQGQIAAEAASAASHFQVLPSSSVQVVVMSPHGVTPSGFGTRYCAWHSSTSSGLPYTNLPYIPDAGSACGAGYVATGSSGVDSATEGVTIVGGHEYAETVTDPLPGTQYGWIDPQDSTTGGENGDKCAWSYGYSGIVTLNGRSFAVQSLYSNDLGSSGGCVISYTSATNQG